MRRAAELVSELTLAGEYHCDVVLVRSGNHVGIANRPTWLNDRGNAGFSRLVDAVSEWKERVRSENCSSGFVSGETRFVNGEKRCIDTRHLSCTDADRRAITSEHDRVRFNGSHCAPREHEILSLVISRLSSRDNRPASELSGRRSSLLQQETTTHSLVIESMVTPLSVAFEHTKIFLQPEYLDGF